MIANLWAFLSVAFAALALIGLINPRWIQGNTAGRVPTFLGNAVLAGFFLYLLHNTDPQLLNWAISAIQTATTPPDLTVYMPDNERAFIAAVLDAKQDYENAPNDMVAGGVRAKRATAICEALSGTIAVTGWIGRVHTLSSNGDGRGVLEIALADDLTLSTNNNAASDALSHRTLIDPASALFKVASSRRVGEPVVFSAELFPNRADCVLELSLTTTGSMIEPEFLTVFGDLAPFSPPSGPRQ